MAYSHWLEVCELGSSCRRNGGNGDICQPDRTGRGCDIWVAQGHHHLRKNRKVTSTLYLAADYQIPSIKKDQLSADGLTCCYCQQEKSYTQRRTQKAWNITTSTYRNKKVMGGRHMQKRSQINFHTFSHRFSQIVVSGKQGDDNTKANKKTTTKS